MYGVVVLCLQALAVHAQSIPNLQMPSKLMTSPALLTSLRDRFPSRPASSSPKDGRELIFSWNPFSPPSSQESNKKRPAPPPFPNPEDNREILTMCKLSEDGSECEQASIAWSRDNPQVLERFGGYSGYKPGNCIQKGFAENYANEKHNIPFIGEIKTRHYRKSSQVQYKGTTYKEDLNLLAILDVRGSMAMIGLVACSAVAFAVGRFRSQASAKAEDPQPSYEALVA